jgi:hypothetical protein
MTAESERNFEKRLHNLTLEIQTIDVLMSHMLQDLHGDHPKAARLQAAITIGEAIQHRTELYR